VPKAPSFIEETLQKQQGCSQTTKIAANLLQQYQATLSLEPGQTRPSLPKAISKLLVTPRKEKV
jgi:hypothetical protein